MGLVLLVALYGGGVWYSARQADRLYSGPQKWILCALWPVLLAANRRFRQNLLRPFNRR